MTAPTLIRSDRPAPGVATLTLNRPDKRNALSVPLREAAAGLLAELAADESIRALVVTGAGEAFSAGFDLADFDRATGDMEFDHRLWASADEWHRSWLEFPVPTIAAVNGPAIAGGFDLAVLCDLRVVDDTAVFAHPEVAFGDVVYGPLHDLVGGAVARDLCFTGRRIDAAEANRLGLVTRLAPPGQALVEAIELAEAVAAAPRSVLARTKAKALRRAGVARPDGLDL